MERFEGTKAARVLLLLERDPRFDPARDGGSLRHATRLWRERRLERYVKLESLASPNRALRIETARFLGDARIERARAPLAAMATNGNEDPIVRAAALESLGALRKGRSATLRLLRRFTDDRNEAVRTGALRGMARLRTKAAVASLIERLDGASSELVRELLVELAGSPVADWKKWLAAGPDGLDDLE